MAVLTLAQAEAIGSAWIKVFKDLRATLDGTYATDIDAVASSPAGVVGDFGGVVQGFGYDHRSNASSLLGSNWLGAGLGPVWREFGRIAAAPEDSDFPTLVKRVYDYRADNAKLVTSRGITYTAMAAGGGNAGTGTVDRLTVDERGYNLESEFVELKTIECIQDAQNGVQKNGEVMEFRGSTASKDLIILSGSGQQRKRTAVAKHAGAGAGGSLLVNSSFEQYVTGATHPFTGWTASDETKVAQNTNNYRGYPGAPDTLYSMKLTGDVSVTQALSVANPPIFRNTPYLLDLMFNRSIGSGDGTLTITMGGVTANVAMAAQVGWTRLRIALTSSCWFRNWDAQAAAITFAMSGTSTGYVLIDDVIFAPFDLFDGTYWWVRGGATPFLIRDVFTSTDTGGAATTGIIRYWLWRWGIPIFPVGSGGAVTWADP